MLLTWLLLGSLSNAPILPVIPGPRPPIVTPDFERRIPVRLVTAIDAGVELAGLRLASILELAFAIWHPRVAAVPESDAVRADSCVSTLTLRITDAGHPGLAGKSDPTPGWIEFVDGEPASTINVSPRAAHTWAARERVAGRPVPDLPVRVRLLLVERALAWSIAHELGHYLLRSTAHASRGLMKARFTVDELNGPLPAAVRDLGSGRGTLPAKC